MGSTVLDANPSTLREHPPSSYSIKFENIAELDDGKYESSLFAAGGYNWRLVIYPKGNAKDEGSGFISMYVEIDSTNLLSSPLTNVFAYLVFFVYNKKTDKYFTIKDSELKRFNAFRTVWGLSQVLSLETFNDSKNGYIFEGDQCEFGVDVLVHPKGVKARDNSLSIYVYLSESETLNAEEKIYTRVHLRVLDPFGSIHQAGQCNFWRTNTNKNQGYGWPTFASLDKVREKYLDNEGSLNIEIEFAVVSSTKYSPVN
ncbi:unnamed protein product [Arabidopsis thaliana]|uniref:MATH domain-containing protein n=1 Tax=Arabidopsis thaliana TaxID=3702 RepID=A0A654FBG0_ARATH|nr:unnamed protein product [Arabidopsis thaliana]